MQHFLDKLNNSNIPIPESGKFNSVFDGINWSVWLIQMGFPIAVRNTGYTSDQAEHILIQNYIKYEKNRNVWSRQHSLEIDRLKEQYLQ